MDNLGDIVTFVRVVASGSFVAAANQLGVTPSAVSKSVSRLEETSRHTPAQPYDAIPQSH